MDAARSTRAALGCGPAGSICFLVLLIGALGCRPSPSPGLPRAPADSEQFDAPGTPRFVDVTQASNVRTTYRNGEEAGARSIVESLGGGVGILDFDRDGRPDLFFPGGGELVPGQPLNGIAGTLFQNLGDLSFVEVTGLAGADGTEIYSHGCTIADYDNDGFPDILVTGYGGLQLFHNQGDGTFVECRREAGLLDDRWSSSAAWGDLNGDGNLDLYVVHYVDWSWDNHPVCPGPQPGEREVCSPTEFKGLGDLVYFSSGDGGFRPAGTEIGLDPAGKGLGVIALDVNLDSRLDVYVANDTTANFLLINEGGKFREEGVVSGTAFDQRGIPNGSMGLATLDYDGDLLPDIWVTNYENETFAMYRNDGGGYFRCLTEDTGITALGTLFVGFGTVAGDFTHRGLEDLVVTNGHVMLFPSHATVAQVPLYLRNTGQGKFERIAFPEESYFSRLHRGRGVAAADLDGDGRLDLVFTHTNEPAVILAGRTESPGSWLALHLIGRAANRDAIGARLVLDTSRGKQLRTVVGGGSYLSQNPYTVHIGLPPQAIVRGVEITWPDGSVQQVGDVAAGTVTRVVQPRP